MNTGTRVANLMSFSCICLRIDLYSFSSSVSSFFSFGVSLPSFSFFACLTLSDLLMIVSMSELRERKPSMRINASRASLLFRSLFRVSLSTLTRRADSQRFARSVALVPAIAISRISCALICFIVLPS